MPRSTPLAEAEKLGGANYMYGVSGTRNHIELLGVTTRKPEGMQRDSHSTKPSAGSDV